MPELQIGIRVAGDRDTKQDSLPMMHKSQFYDTRFAKRKFCFKTSQQRGQEL